MAEDLPGALFSCLSLHSSLSFTFLVSDLQHTLQLKTLPLLPMQNPLDDAPPLRGPVQGAAGDRTFTFYC